MVTHNYTLGCYLLDRLAEVGVQDMFGVPGDFNLRFLDDVMTHSIKWIGTANELNAAYAADGYARCRGIGCFLTTYGVGELSAVNGVAGAYAESVPVIHIAGTPSYAQMNKRLMLHHSLGDGDFLHYLRVSKELSCVAEMLTPEHARQQIDTVITEVLYHKKPGYIGLPMDVAEMECCPSTSPLVYRLPLYCEESLDAFEESATALLQDSSSCCLLVGHLVKIMCLEEVVNRFVEAVDIPYAVTYWGKGSVNEHYQNFIGSYSPPRGQSSFCEISCSSGGSGGASVSAGTANDHSHTSTLPCTLSGTVLHAADVLITFGMDRLDVLKYDRMLSEAEALPRRVHVLLDGALIGNQRYTNIPMHKAIAVLQELCQSAVENCWGPYTQRGADIQSQFNKDFEVTKSVDENSSKEIISLDTRESAHEYWKRLWETVQISLRPWDIILTDAPSDIVHSLPLRLPEGCMHITQSAYESPGYVVPAALGCQAAFPDRRVICVIRDKEIHRALQELGTIIRSNMKIHVIIVSNSEAISACDTKGIKESHPLHPSNRKCLCWRNIIGDISPHHEKVIAKREVTKEGIASLLSDINGEGMMFIETDLLVFRS